MKSVLHNVKHKEQYFLIITVRIRAAIFWDRSSIELDWVSLPAH